MKKIALIMICLLVGFVSQAQDKSITLGSDTYYWEFGVNATADTVGIATSDSTYDIQILTNKDQGLLYNIRSVVTKVTGTAAIKMQIKGKVHSADSWTLIASTYWTGTTNSALSLSQTSTAQFYRYFQIHYGAVGSSGQVRITTALIKFWHL
jgi:hypothetical protein